MNLYLGDVESLINKVVLCLGQKGGLDTMYLADSGDICYVFGGR